MKPRLDDLRALTGVRGVAALLVMFYHLSTMLAAEMHVPPPAVFTRGYLAVDLFFVLSGFVLAYNYQGDFSSRIGSASYFRFMAKRVARIFPLYLVLLAVYAIKQFYNFSEAPQPVLGAGDWLLNLFALHGWGFHTVRVIGASWSISTEMLAYILLPFLLSVFTISRIARIMGAVASGAGLLVVIAYGHGVRGPLDVVASGSLLPALRCLTEFTLGVLTCFAFRLPWPAGYAKGSAVFVATGAAIFLSAFLGWDWWLGAVLFPLAVLTMALRNRVADTLFANAPIHYLGVISYSMYLVHPLFAGAAIRAGQKAAHLGAPMIPVAYTVFVALTLGAAAMLYRLVEVPGLQLVRALHPGQAQKSRSIA